jgi:co-chaperonin GroES (HSP10)
VKEEVSGTLELPHSAQKLYEIGRVVAVGDGLISDGKGGQLKKVMHIKPGELVWFQINAFMVASNLVNVGGKSHMVVHQHDVLAILKKPQVKLENFQIAGRWCLLDSWIEDTGSRIIIPDTVNKNFTLKESLHFNVYQKGSQVDNVLVGQEVIPDPKQVQPVKVGDKEFYYIDSSCIYGIVEK